ncbi:virulence factor SrfC family protein [Serratia sp. AKBS12]|uniref:virulence factor SrfC family protein n=1 Tax=Serratia sp. AKBS12 TaxID=2974597 RepID=UPI002165DCD3|nr:virulence factor SrfC family protein [Serratia sp. AKBS12]MCS3408650.1 virulence factor SrfC family protein [Serratia sp. AKBS12]
MNPLTTNTLVQQAQHTALTIGNIADWLNHARQHSTRLAIEADRLHLALHRSQRDAGSLAQAASDVFSIGIYGRVQAENASLAGILGRQAMQVAPPTLILRYRHCATIAAPRLTLLAEADLIKLLFITAGAPALDEQRLNQQLAALKPQRQTLPVAGMSPCCVTSLREALLRHRPQTPPANAFWLAATALAPYLDIDRRAQLFAPLWNSQPQLTGLYRQLAHSLHGLGSRHIQLPAGELPYLNGIIDGNLAAHLNSPQDRRVQIQTLDNDDAERRAFSLAELALLSIELCLSQPVENDPFSEPVDILDIPAGAGGDTSTPIRRLMQAKRACLLEYCTDRRQPQLLLVGSTATRHQDVAEVGKALTDWQQRQQGEQPPLCGDGKPDLMWVFSQRRASARQKMLDDAVQRYVSASGAQWGSLLALDASDARRMLAYLAAAAKGEMQRQRIAGLLQALRREVRETLLGGWHQSAESQGRQKRQTAQYLLKALQARTGVHGELLERLLPDRDRLRRLQRQAGSIGPAVDDRFSIGVELDLLTNASHRQNVTPDNHAFADALFADWICHLRALPFHGAVRKLLALEQTTLNLLVDELINAAFRLDLAAQLRHSLAAAGGTADRQISQALSVLGDFVAWLGFQHLPASQRPASRIHQGQPIFVSPAQMDAAHPARLTQLPATPVNGAAFYIYDWLVGLNTLIEQNEGHDAANSLDNPLRARLAALREALA